MSELEKCPNCGGLCEAVLNEAEEWVLRPAMPDREALIGVINEWADRAGCWLGSAFGPQFRMAVKESLADRIIELFGAKK